MLTKENFTEESMRRYAKYKNPDNDVTPWASDNLFAPDEKNHQGMLEVWK